MTEIEIPVGKVKLKGILEIPKGARAIIIFAHGAGSSRLSPRNQYVASVLQNNEFATLLFDLLTEQEDGVYESRFNIDLLAKRLEAVTAWVKTNYKKLKIGYFGASTGSAAALQAANVNVFAIVSRSGRPDLVMPYLHKVKAPVLLLVGGLDDEVIALNKKAYETMTAEKKLLIVPDASHLFEEEGKLQQVAKYAVKWCVEKSR